ncbi:GbsR/MarR family transcriptional regulator [Sphingopyxis sp. J-6]|uniref:GbsR/MarR family transcriptional regulator n=1 Tax=Sphingopyxis sp. J-6 TaxID=3122054 RepID=UPI00269F35EC
MEPSSAPDSLSPPCRLSPLAQAFVLHFGEMGSRWGINRTVGQIYAMLFLAEVPRHAEEISEALSLSRGSVSMGLKELASWKLVQLRHLPGDRRDYYETPRDVWAIFRTLVEERKKREIDPTLTTLRGLMLEPATDPADRFAQERMAAMHEQIELLTDWYAEMQRLDNERLLQLLRLGSRVVKALEFKDRMLGRGKGQGLKEIDDGRD